MHSEFEHELMIWFLVSLGEFRFLDVLLYHQRLISCVLLYDNRRTIVAFLGDPFALLGMLFTSFDQSSLLSNIGVASFKIGKLYHAACSYTDVV